MDAVRAAVEVNVWGVIRLTNAVLPLLRRSPSPRIVNVSSGVGSLTRQAADDGSTGPLSAAYSPSKTYLNAVTLQYAKAYPEITFTAVEPGYTATDMTAAFDGGRSPAESARVVVGFATRGPGGPSGTLQDESGVLAW